MRSSRLGFFAPLLVIATNGLTPAIVTALPSGRAWAPNIDMTQAGTSEYLGQAQLWTDKAGVPYVLIDVKWDSAAIRNWNSLAWSNLDWRAHTGGSFDIGGLATRVLGPVSPSSVVTLGVSDPQTLWNWLLIFDVARDTLGTPDSVFTTTQQSTEFGGAASRTRRWAVRADNDGRNFYNQIHTLYSDTVNIWHEVERLGVNEDHCTMAPLGDTTAIVVYAGESGLEYAILDGSRWIEIGSLDRRPFNASHPRFRVRPSGGLWLFWESFDWMHMSSFRNGVWERGDSMQFIPNPGDHYQPAWFSTDHDTTEYPVIVWNNLGYAQTFRDAAVISFPNGQGWDPPEELPGSERVGWIEPTVVRDLNDDVWVVWRRTRDGINVWTHTYCSATCAAPAVVTAGTVARVTWALSSRAPGSRWTVERAVGESPFDSIGTVRAGADSLLSFEDPNATPGLLWHYRIRRESLDARFVWHSEPASLWRPDAATPLELASPVISGARLSFRVSGGSGALTARLYDLQGRVAAERRVQAAGTGDDTIIFDLGQQAAGHSGIYFLRVSDATGRTTRTSRVAIVR